MAGTCGACDSLYATDGNSVDLLHKSIATWTTEDVKVEPVLDTVFPGNNPFNAIVNQWSAFINLKSGQRRRFRAWIPDADVEVKGTIIIVHGFAEHSARYNHVAKYFNDNGFRVFGFDHRFHGDDDDFVGWKIKDIKTFDEIVDDAVEIIGYIEEKCADLPYFIFGHSMGGMITVRTILRMQETWKCQGVVLSNPLVKAFGNVLAPFPYAAFYRGLARCLSSISPLLPSPGLAPEDLSRLPEVVQALKDDPKCFGDKVSTRFACAMVTNASYDTQKRLHEIACPFFIIIGEMDKAVVPSGGIMLYERASSGDKTIKKYNLYHEMHNEEERDNVLSDVVNWFTSRLA